MMPNRMIRSNPFHGLRPYRSEESHLFFGFEGQSNALVDRLESQSFVAVVGASGSGKSSLINAGLISDLQGGLMLNAGSGWRIASMRPGNNPIQNMAVELSDPTVLGSQRIEDGATRADLMETILRSSSLGLVEAAGQANLQKHENLLLIVDQFEELFRYKDSVRKEYVNEEPATFIKLILAAITQKELPIYVVITMRSDFLGDCAQFRGLPEAINSGLYLIPRMKRDERQRAIEGPVAVAGAKITPRLVQRILNDIGDDPDQLPILQHALMRTWEYWAGHSANGDPIDLPDYEASGGVGKALSRHAEDVFATLPDNRSKAVAERLFKRITERGPDNREIRRPAPVAEIAAIAESNPAEVISIVEHFRAPGRSFLMPPLNQALNEGSIIDISHESLIRQWDRLRQWVDEEVRDGKLYRRLLESAELYQQRRTGLLSALELQTALDWQQELNPNPAWAQLYGGRFEDVIGYIQKSQGKQVNKFVGSGFIRIAGVGISIILTLLLLLSFTPIMAQPLLLWGAMLIFGIVGAMRGWAKEILVTFSFILALFLITILETYAGFFRTAIAGAGPTAQFWVRAIIVLLLVFFGTQVPNIQGIAGVRFARERLQDTLLGSTLGALNGYLVVGTIWWYLHTANYPFPEIISPPTPGTPLGDEAIRIISLLPPVWLTIPWIYFAVAIAFLFIVIVFADWTI